jgi:DNA repair protein RadC
MPSSNQPARRKPVDDPGSAQARAFPAFPLLPQVHQLVAAAGPPVGCRSQNHGSDTDALGEPATAPRVECNFQALTDAELLGLLLSGGHFYKSSLSSARKLLLTCGGLDALLAGSGAMLQYGGLRDSQASALLAARELACRLARHRIPHRHPLARPADVARFLTLQYQQRDQEVMGALFLDVRHCLLGHKEIYRGTLHRAAVEPREILKECLLRGAGGVALFHTHPSGDPTPSSEDLLFTRRMAEAAALIGVELVDHLVLGTSGRWLSLRERGVW